MAGTIGDVDIRIGADAKPFESDLNSTMNRVSATVGKTFGNRFETMFSRLPGWAQTAASKVSTALGGIADRFPRVTSAFQRGWSAISSGASKAASALSSTFKQSFDVIQGAAATAFVAVGAIIAANMGRAVQRADILNNFPKVMENIGFSADDAASAIEKIADSLDGLPTTTQSIASLTQSLAPLTGSVGKAADISLALNNALLAGGAAAGLQENAMEQYRQMLARGTVDLMSWRSLQSAMPGQLDQVARSLLGVTANGMDLYDAMQDGTVSLEDFNEALLALNEEGIDGLASFEEQARAATGGIGTAFANAGNRVAAAITKIIQHFGVDNIGQAINDFTAQFSGWADKIIEYIEKVQGYFERIGDSAHRGLGPIIGLIAGVASQLLPFLQNIPLIGTAFQGLTGPVGAFIGLLVQMWQNSETLRDALKNAFSTIGNALEGASPAFETLATLVGEVATLLGDMLGEAINFVVPLVMDLAEAVGPLISQALEMFLKLIQKLSPILAPLGGIIAGVAGAFKLLSPILGPIISAFKFLLPLLSGLASPIGLAIAAIAGLVAGFVWLWNNVEGFRNFWEGVWDAIVAAAQAVADWFSDTLMPVFEKVWENIKPGLESLGEFFSEVWESILAAVSVVVDWFTETLVPALTETWDLLVEGVTAFGEMISGVWEALWEFFEPVVTVVWEKISTVIGVAIEVISTVIGVGLEVISAIWSAVWGVISAVAETVWGVITTIVETAIGIVQGVISAVTAVIQGDWDGVWNAIKGIIDTVWQGIQSVVTTVINGISGVISSVLSGIRNIWNTAWNAVRNKISEVWEGIRNGVTRGIDNVMSAIRNLKSRLTGFFAGALGWLVNAGRNVIQGFINGITAMIGSVMDAVGGVVSAVRDFLPFSPAKRGPLSGRGYTLYSGQHLVEDLARGIDSKSHLAYAAMDHTLEGVLGAVTDFDLGNDLAKSLADGLLDGESEVVRAAEAIAKAAASAMDTPITVGVGAGELRPLDRAVLEPSSRRRQATSDQAAQASTVVNIGTVTIDPSKFKDVEELTEHLKKLGLLLDMEGV